MSERTVALMVSRAGVSLPEVEAGSAARRQRETQRWSLFLSVFGALAASAVLWALLIVGVSAAMGWVNSLF